MQVRGLETETCLMEGRVGKGFECDFALLISEPEGVRGRRELKSAAARGMPSITPGPLCLTTGCSHSLQLLKLDSGWVLLPACVGLDVAVPGACLFMIGELGPPLTLQ